MPFRPFVAQVALKLESTYSAPVAGDVFAVYDASYEHDVQLTPREDITGNHMKFTGIPGARMGRIKFSCDMKGSGVATTPPEFGEALRGCNFDEVIGGSNVAYSGAIAESNQASVWFYVDGIRHAISNAFGTVKFVLSGNGRPVRADFEFMGIMQPTTAVALVAGVSYDTTVPPAVINATAFGINGVTTTLVPRSFTFDFGNEVVMRDAINVASGYAGAWIGNRRGVGTIELECPTIAILDIWTNLQTPTTGIVTSGVIGGTAGNRYNFTFDVASITKIALSNSGGLYVATLDFLFGRSGATVEGADFQLNFT